MLENQLHVGVETTYGTPVAPTRSFEVLADAHKRATAFLESKGMRAGSETTRSTRRRPINMGGEGALELEAENKGLGILLKAAFGTSTIVQEAATTAWTQTHTTDPEGPAGESLTVQMGREPISGAVLPFTAHGGKVTGWEFSQALDSYLKFKLDMDFEDIDTSTALLAVPVYPAFTDLFGWDQFSMTVDGNAVDAKDYSAKGQNNLATDRRFLRSSVLKKEPVRKGHAAYSGKLSAEFESGTHYDRFVAGTIVPIVATWTGDVIEGAFNYKIEVTHAACQFDGETPQGSLDDLSMQDMPFTVLDNATDPAVSLTFTTTDTAY